MDLWYPIVHPNFHSLIILRIIQGEYTLFSANIFVGLRACIESLTAREKFRISERKVQIIAMIGW